MRINLEENELKTAIREFIANQGLDIRDKEIKISLIAGRGDNGHRAEVEIMPSEVATETATSPDDEPAVPDFDFGGEQSEED